ncbi:MAG: hypothetical protein MJK12_11675 [Colwellia sp.]|nr:hypothetical protein [Colwellia sp.]
MNNVLVENIGYLAAVVVIFLILRAVVLWYWRINDVVKLLEEINHNIRLIAQGKSNVTKKNLTTNKVDFITGGIDSIEQ